MNYGGGAVPRQPAVSYQDEAYWQDVLDSRYAGTTDAFTLVNGSSAASGAASATS